MTDETNGVKAVDNTIQIIETLKELDSAGITELSREVDLSKSSIHSHLVSLEENGFVNNNNGTYSLGLKPLELGGYVRDNQQLFQLSQSVVDDIARETGELAVLTTEADGQSVYLYKARGSTAMSLDAHLGSKLLCHCTAAGKAIMAYLPRERVEGIVDTYGLPAFTDQTITDRDRLFEELAEIHEQNLSIDNEERIDGMVGIAAVIKNETTDEVLGALGITGPTNRMTEERIESVGDLIKQHARMIEIDATYS